MAAHRSHVLRIYSRDFSPSLVLLLGDLLENYCWNDDLMNFSRVLFSISILLTFPIECFVSREVSPLHCNPPNPIYYSLKPEISIHSQIVKCQWHRYKTHAPIEVNKECDPSLEVGQPADDDEHNTAITMAIVLTAFIISPMTECLGPVLELNVMSILLYTYFSGVFYLFAGPAENVFNLNRFVCRVCWPPFHWRTYCPVWHTFKWSRIRCSVVRNCLPLDSLCSVRL